MVFNYKYCSATFANRGNQSRHEHRYHPDEVGLPVFTCCICTFTCRKLSELEQHMRTCHQKFTNCCRSCYMGFNDTRLFAQHMSSLHSLPVFGDQFQPTQAPVETAFNGTLQSYHLPPSPTQANADLAQFMLQHKPQIDSLIEQKFSQGSQKVQFSAHLQLRKPSQNEDQEDELIEIYANSLMTPVYSQGLSSETFWTMVEKMMIVLTTFASNGSGWVLEKVIKIIVNFARYRPITGSSYIALPSKLQNCRGLLNIRNHEDANCFLYCYIAAYHMHNNISLDRPGRNYNTDKTSPETYKQANLHQPTGHFDMPMGLEDINQFENLNEVRINVFGYDGRDLFPLRVSKFVSNFTMDLLLLYEADCYHYVLITNLVKVVCQLRNTKFRFAFHICRNCFWLCEEGLAKLTAHMETCCENAPAVVRLPAPGKNLYKFKNLAATWFVPLVIYFDFESFLYPVARCTPHGNNSYTRVIEKHELCGFSLAVIDHYSTKPIFFHVDSSEDCITKFVNMLHTLAKDIYKRKRAFPFFRGDRSQYPKSAASECWICNEAFDDNDEQSSIDLDHCHYGGQFLGWAHEKCNRARRNVNFTPVVGHNIQNYDLHHICLALQSCEPTTTVSVIPSTDEKYISMNFGVLVETITLDDGKVIKKYENLRFIDSFKIMNSSLERLVDILPRDRFGILASVFPNLSSTELKLLQQKGYYPYSYVSGREKFSENSLPPLNEWRNTLEGNAVTITQENLNHAKTMWNTLNCPTLQDYHAAYLKTDCALLACVCEFHRELSFCTYKLDCMHFYTLPNMAKEASLRICKAEVELLTEREHLDMIEGAVRGGVCSVYEMRKFTANNKYLPDYDSSQPSTFGFCVDANNLYGGVMQNEKLPQSDFTLNSDITLAEILNCPDGNPVGYFVEVDLHYPASLHDYHQDFPLAPSKNIVEDDWLSDYQVNLRESHNLPPSKVPKLLQTFFDKDHYVLHYKLLKLYVNLGLVVKKMHRVLQFTQNNWLTPYITLNSEKRQAASNKFEESFYKLMNNAVYGKNCESKRRRMKIELTRDARRTLTIVSKFEFEKFKVFGENMAALSSRPRKIYWDTPTIVGATILDLAKYYMYQFHYGTMRSSFDCRLLYSDTDSLLYRINCEDLYRELKESNVLDQFDFSNYPEDHELYSEENKRVVLKFKDEFAGDYIKEFICLKPKLYSITPTSECFLFNDSRKN